MLRVFYGTDQIKVRQAAHAALDELLSDTETFVRIEAEGYESGLLTSLSGAVSLFSPRSVYLLESPSLNEEFQTDFVENADALASSEHIFIVIEQALNAADKKTIAKHATVIEEFKKKADESFNPFVLADALATKDKRSLWLLLQTAKGNGLSAEEIIGTLWWQLKSIRQAAATRTPAEAGMKEYPYKKAKNALRVFPVEMVEEKSRTLLKLYHDGHKGKRDLDIALEEWVLTL